MQIAAHCNGFQFPRQLANTLRDTAGNRWKGQLVAYRTNWKPESYITGHGTAETETPQPEVQSFPERCPFPMTSPSWKLVERKELTEETASSAIPCQLTTLIDITAAACLLLWHEGCFSDTCNGMCPVATCRQKGGILQPVGNCLSSGLRVCTSENTLRKTRRLLNRAWIYDVWNMICFAGWFNFITISTVFLFVCFVVTYIQEIYLS